MIIISLKEITLIWLFSPSIHITHVYVSIKVVFLICLIRLDGLTFALKLDQKVKKKEKAKDDYN